MYKDKHGIYTNWWGFFLVNCSRIIIIFCECISNFVATIECIGRINDKHVPNWA